jgi:hypothetical protein
MVNNPTGNNGLTANLLPSFYQTPANKKFLQATLDQLYQPGSVTKINGYIGQRNSKASTGNDTFISAPDSVRQNYQLEPGVTITDSMGNITLFKDYIDFINQLNVFGGNTSNHARVNEQEFYSWDPHINWDKLVNFQNYYWLPYGPEVITISGQQQKVISSYSVELQSNGNSNQYVFTPNGLTTNPVIKLYRGQTYHFNILSPNNPFSFKLSRKIGSYNRYTLGVSTNGIQNGSITFTVDATAPDLIYYQSESDINAGGAIEIYDITEDTFINVEADVLGKKTYVLSDGTELSNGMKVQFSGNVLPENYATGQYYVEGVGTAIKLIPESILEIVSPYTTSESIQFDNTPFDKEPFGDATGFASIADYIVINRASRDRNPWSRYNRWFHKDIITASAIYNKAVPEIDQLSRATRPIIEFNENLKLFNFGTIALPDVDLIDDFTTDAFSIIEGSAGYNIDGVSLVQGQRILFTADPDPFVKNKIFRVEFVDVQHLNTGSFQIHLVEEESPSVDQIVLIKDGIKNQSLLYWFDGNNWIKAQQKYNTNQPPLFDVVDSNGVSFGNRDVYNGSTFSGTQLFSYKKGTSIADPVLGFALTYQNVSNIGDIVFNFDLATDVFQYKKSTSVIDVKIDVGFLVSYDYSGNIVYENGWQTSKADYVQAAIRIYKNSNKINNFDIDIFDVDLSEIELDQDDVRVYINAKRVAIDHWSLIKTSANYQVVLAQPVAVTDIVTIKVFSPIPINNNGYYEIPVSLQNNPLNNSMGVFTLGEVIDHVNSIIDNVYNPEIGNDATDIDSPKLNPTQNDVNGVTFIGVFPGTSNLRDLGNITPYGTKFVQHSGPASLSLFHVTSESNNVIKAIEQARDDYNSFKRNFIAMSEDLGIDGDPVVLVDLILEKLNKDKPKTSPYYFSDMIPYGASLKTDLKVVDFRIKTYPLSTVFTLDTLSNKAVGVYLDGVQLVHGRDYLFNSQGFIIIAPTLAMSNGSVITTYEYESTDGSFVPATPSKFGMWPSYEPKIYTDTTVNIPNGQLMIQGHDGSQILAYGDYRDQVILELEKRIFNNIKVKYDPAIFDINSIIPSYNRVTSYSLSEYNTALAPSFYKWAKTAGIDFAKPITYDVSNTFTYNYSYSASPDQTSLPGYWRGVYRWLLDTDRPQICPWEMLGYSNMPVWWIDLYGPAPYTSDNLVMWKDIADGAIREPGKPVSYRPKYAKPFLMGKIPVNELGELLSPLQSGLASGTTPGVITPSSGLDFIFGDVAPVEAAWRRSSHYPFSVLVTTLLLTPSSVIGRLLDRSRIKRNLAGQLVYTETGLRIRPQDVLLPSIYSSESRVQTAGIVNYIVDLILNYIFSNNLKSYNTYALSLLTMNVQLGYRLGAFTNKNQFNLLLDSKTPASSGSVFIPAEDFSVILNKSNPVKKLTYSGVIITRLSSGYQVLGYSQTHPYFKYYNYTQSGKTINIGGISESFSEWTPGQQYVVGTIVKYNGVYFRTTVSNTSTSKFDESYFINLPDLPVNGGVNVVLRKIWDKSNEITVPYGSKFTKIQDVVDFLQGYGQWLNDQGFEFNEFNNSLGQVSNWESSAKEFLFWTTQNWSAGQDKWNEWTPNQIINYGTIVRYNGYYYSANKTIPSSDTFNAEDFTKLDGLSSIGSSVISLSPSAGDIVFKTSLAVVDDINNLFNSYEIFKVDGTAIQTSDLNSYRNENTVNYTPRTADGIYGASFYLIQHEHIIVIKNKTIFNDTIYNPESGYRQERIKVSAYVTPDWYGGLDIPGFVFDQAIVNTWQPWKDYNMGDIVSYQGYYYSANKFLPGSIKLLATDWTQLENKPTPKIIPNWTNLATQFADFYSLDTDSFDLQQQIMGQHLLGYQKRQYLDNIIQDDVSEFKFYQGMIREKGTQNVLNKLFDVLSSENKESLNFYEEWAIRVGQYGANSAFQQIEFIIDESLIRSNPQAYDLVQQKDSDINSFIVQQSPTDVYLKSDNYNSAPWPKLPSYSPFLRSAGHVNSGDVSLVIGNISNITNYDTSTLVNGSYIWCTFDAPPAYWNVYRFTDVGISVTGVTYSSATSILTVSVENLVSLSVGSYVGIAQTAKINGFYKITSVTLNSFTVSAIITGFSAPFPNLSSITIYALQPQRVTSIDLLDSVLPDKLKNNELLWTDNIDNGDGIWATWSYNPAYSLTSISNSNPSVGLTYGRSLSVAKSGDVAALSVSDGRAEIYTKPGLLTSWIKHQIISRPSISANTAPGVNLNSPSSAATVLAISDDKYWLATGSPFAGYASTRLVQDQVHGNNYVQGTSYAAGAIVSSGNQYYQAPLTSKISNVGTVSQVTSVNNIFDTTGPWVIKITSMDNTAGLTVSGTFKATDKTASLFGNYPTSVVVQSIDSSTSITCLVTGGIKPTLGGITGITVDISGISNNYVVSGISLTQGQGARFTIVVTGSSYTINVVSGGAGYKVGNKIKIFGSAVGGVDTVNDIIITVVETSQDSIKTISYVGSTPTQTYLSLPGTVILGTGATFNVVPTLVGYNVSVNNGGTGYVLGDKILISGASLSGDNILNDVLVTVTSLTSGSITTINQIGISSWSTIPYIPVDLKGANLSSTPAHGVISLYQKDANNEYILVDTILSPVPSANENFGSSLTFGAGVLYIGASGYNSNKGRVYKFKFATVTNVSTAYNPVGSHNAIIAVTSTLGIKLGMFIQGIGFTTGQYVTNIIDSVTLELNGSPNSTPSGVLNFVTTKFIYDTNEIFTGSVTGENFGSSVSLSTDGNTLLISNAGGTTTGKVFVYKKTGTTFSTTPSQTLVGLDRNFGRSIAVSDAGTYIAISDDIKSTSRVNQQGVVGVYSYNGTSYTLYQELINRKPEIQGRFGNKLAFMNDYETLVVYSQAGDTTTTTTFNTKGVTTFDKDSTKFVTTQINTGRVDVYDMYSSKWVFSETLPTDNTEKDGYGTGFAVGANQIFVGAPFAMDRNVRSGQIYNYSKLPNTYSWTVTNKKIDLPDVSKIKTAFLYNRSTGNLIKYLDIVDPLQGKIPGPAEEEIRYKTFYDPAIYSVGDSSVVVDSSSAWSNNQVGQLWWNLSTAKFVNAYDRDLVYRNSNWNTLAVGASIDIYEWVSSTLKPSQWDTQADTVAGLAIGISGKSLYGDLVYSSRQTYDKISKNFKNIYFYWVKNKKVIPNIAGRFMSAQDVSSLIGNPRGQDYTYLALTGLNTFSLANIKPFLNNDNVVLSVEYWTIDKTDQNVHSQWKIISSDPTTILPKNIEQKWIDSFCGTDVAGRQVPDPQLPVKIRYGVENRPRQSMFVNRFEALKEFVENTNQILLTNRIVESSNLSSLESYDTEPNIISGLYDTVLDTELELDYANVTSFVTPTILPVVDANGKITGIDITISGKGYLVAPYIEIIGDGTGAVVRSILNAQGQIVGSTIISSGEGYITGQTYCQIRSYSILVHSDSQAEGNWSIYSYDPTYKIWSRVLTKSYDVRKYWSFVDWYDTGFNQFTLADYAVNTFSDLNSIETYIGETIKIRTANSGGWLLLEKYSDVISVDWTLSYKVIGIQNGTIQLDASLYEFTGTNVGYDSSTFDGDSFDIVAAIELRIILNSIKNNILVNDLKHHYIDLFFNSIRYILSEQVYVDWIFKTSFVKAHHNVGMLSQPVSYPVDNLSNFEDYVSEVKPYRTKIREYVSNYENLDLTRSAITDFDLQPIYENNRITLINASVKHGKIQADDSHIQSYPWKFWLDNVGFNITDIALTSGGSGYLTEPTIRFVSDSGTGATARAFFTNGVINRIVLLTPGTGYLSAPTIIFDGGLSTTGVPAEASAIIGNSVIRSTMIGIKFDRLTQTRYITQLQQVETFTGTGSSLQFKLKWSPDNRLGQSLVTVNGIPALRELYNLVTVSSTSKGYTTYAGLLTFATGEAPATGDVIVVTYLVNYNILNSADRINYYYNPSEGDLGKDLSQLMTGIDYGGVIVDGLGFNVSKGWGSGPYFKDKWDSFDGSFDDYFITVSANTHSFTLPYIPDAGTEINIYHIENSVDSYTSNGVDTEYNYNVASINPVATTVTTVKSSGVQTTYTSLGSFDTTIKVSSTTGIVTGMGVFGTGFATVRTVVSILDSTTLIINKASDSLPSGTLTFTFNFSGSTKLTLESTNNIHTGDLIATSAAQSFLYDSAVKTIIDSTTVEINTVLYASIPYHSDIKFTRTLVQPANLIINANGIAVLTNPIPLGVELNITGKVNPVRLDDPYYGTVDQTNTNAILTTFIADGESSTFTIPNTFTVIDGDEFILRKTTSDGSILPATTDYDTSIIGGDWAYTTATGLLADDILIDGDGFVTPTSSPAPEEVVPGQVVDTVAIKVYDRPTTGSAKVQVDNFVANGTKSVYKMSQSPNSPEAIIVKVDKLIKTYPSEYSIDYKKQTITLSAIPTSGSIVSIFNIGFNGSNILDLDYFVGDGVTTEFVTKAPWLTSFTSLIYLNGKIISPDLFKTDGTYDFANAVGIKFINPPAAGSLINFIIVSGNQQTFAITKTEKISTDGSLTYQLAYPIGTSLPNESNMLVRVDQTILQGPNDNYFVINKNRLNYTIDPAKINPYTAEIDQIFVFADGKKLTRGSDYTVDLGGITVKISKSIYTLYSGKNLVISVTTNDGYFYNSATQEITFAQSYDNTHTVEVISSYNHTVLDIQRTTINITANVSLTPNTLEFYYYKGIASGLIKLDRSVIDDNYVWIVKNSTLLTPSIDYRLNDDRVSVQLLLPPDPNDKITLITFGSNVLSSGIAYQQFKDMLNRVHFKRLSSNKRTALARDLHWNDTTIEVLDASNFDTPNPSKNLPGVIEIRGERIEYYGIQGNILSKLRRGTLGTGVYNLHKSGAFVQDIGPTETIPYNEVAITEQIISDGTHTVNLGFVPGGFDTSWTYLGKNMTTSQTASLAKHAVEVFVGGYDTGSEWTPTTLYTVGTIVTVGSYTYRCITAHTSSAVFNNDSVNWSFFIGNIRLKKSAYKVHNVNTAPYSPEGDINLPEDFTVDGVTKQVHLTNLLNSGTQVTIVKRTGTAWDSTVNIQSDNTKIAEFLKASPGIWYSDYKS